MEIEKPTKQYKSDGRLVFSCQYHVVFCPKYRRSVLVDGIDLRLKQIIIDKQKEYKYEVVELEIMPDHVHLLLSVNPKQGIYKIISQIKGYSSKTLRQEFPTLKSRLPSLWTHAKFISTVGSVSLDVVKKYIQNQKNV